MQHHVQIIAPIAQLPRTNSGRTPLWQRVLRRCARFEDKLRHARHLRNLSVEQKLDMGLLRCKFGHAQTCTMLQLW